MKTLGLYIHLPFCVRKCLYCDFYSITDLGLIDDYIKAVISNIKNYPGVKYDTIYFGGGTPSLMPASAISEIIEAANPLSGAEISMECNPQSSDSGYFRDIKSAGVNRLSIGIQSLDNKTLKKLGRLHNAETAVKTVYNAYDKGFDNISADIMLGVSDTPIDFYSLSKLPLTHISAYILKIEENTPFFSLDNLNLPEEDSVCDSYLETIEALSESGFYQYEISNFTKPSFECKHNLKYWECKEYLGIGPSAHSYYNGKRFAVPRDIEKFINSQFQQTFITDDNPGGAEEKLMLGIRLTKRGINFGDYPGIESKARRYIDREMLKQSGDNITLTPKGALISNRIISDLI
jgi:oxygen-independent coproporphyrinogen-3 oxidase